MIRLGADHAVVGAAIIFAVRAGSMVSGMVGYIFLIIQGRAITASVNRRSKANPSIDSSPITAYMQSTKNPKGEKSVG